MITPYDYARIRIFFATALFVFVSHVLSSQALAQDTTNVVFDDPYQYPLSDPRNPNCPCHKQQQMANDEFEKLVSGGRGVRQPAPMFETKSNTVANAQIGQQASARIGSMAGTQSVRSNGLRKVISNADHWRYKKSKRFKQNFVGRQRVVKKLKKCFLF